MIKICKICGKEHNNSISDLCCKHYNQLKIYGKIKSYNSRTVFDSNEIREFDDYIEVDTYDQFGNVIKTFKVDKEYIDLVKKYKWRCSEKGTYIKSYYMITTINKKVHYFHRLLFNNNTDEIDHINRDSTDNRKINLRISNRKQQLYNTRKRKSNSNYKGVYFNKNRIDTKPWHAEIKINNYKYCSPTYKTENEAIYARYLMEQLNDVKCYQNNDVLQSAIVDLSDDLKYKINKDINSINFKK